jgi:TonB-linked SusC/RagA family outer membrane protein
MHFRTFIVPHGLGSAKQNRHKAKILQQAMTSALLGQERSHRRICKTISLAMKFTAILLLVASLGISAKGFTQTISLSEKNVTLDKVFDRIKKQTNYTFVYTETMLQKASRVSINISNASIEQVLQLCFSNQPLSYTILNKMVIIKDKQESPKENAADEAPLLDISGKVTDTDGNPLAGATVKVKGTSKGTTTRTDGVFILKDVDGDAVLEISYVGYTALTIEVNKRTIITASLKLNPSPLDEMQVIAYGKVSKRLQIGNVSSVKSKDIEKQPVQNPLLALQGRVTGLVVTQNSGVPGGGVTVRVQGQNSISNGNDPLFVVDGVPVSSQLPPSVMGYVLGESGTGGAKGNPLNFIDINSIESIEVLKDADATSIYGSRAANGAILITTKKGKAGRTSFDVKLQSGIGKLTRHLKMMNTRQYLDMRYEALKNNGLSMDPNRDYDLTLWDTTRYTDWQKELLGGRAKYHNINATLQGGTSAIQYRISGNYNKETTVFPGNFADEKAAVNFAITNKSTNGKFNLVFSGNYLYDKNKLPTLDLTHDAIGLAPNTPSMLNPDGTINWAPTSSGLSTFTTNPFVKQLSSYENKTDNLISNLTASYSLSKDLSFKTSAGYRILRSNEFIGKPLSVVPPESRSLPQQRSAQYGDRKQSGWNVEPQINYNKTINNHHFDLLAGLTYNSSATNAGSVIGYDYLSDALLQNRAAAATLRSSDPTTMSEYRYNALFGRLSYNYLNRYLINITARRDGSSRFGKENKFENFGSIGGAWIFNEEGFLKDFSKIISFGKLKISYGTTGSDQIPDYNYLSLYSLQFLSNLDLYQGIRGLQPSGLPNPHLQWEKTKKFNAGIDLGLFDNRMLLNMNYAVNRSSNQLLSYALASTAGFQDISSNFPALIENNSWEFALNTTNIKGKDFQWTSNFNLTIPKNQLVEFPNLESSSYANRVSIGQPINVRSLYKFAGVNATTGHYQFYTNNGHITLDPDVNEDRTTYQDPNPKFYGGFENTVRYKNFQLDFLFQFTKQLGPNILLSNGTQAPPGLFTAGDAVSNQPVTVLDRWQKPGDQSSVEKFSTSSSPSFYNAIILSTAAFTDASFIRLKNVSFSYLIPKGLGKPAGLSSGRIFFQAQNLLTITNYKGLDPENAGYPGSITLPPLCVMTFGVQLSF